MFAGALTTAVLTTTMPPSTRSSTSNALSTYRELCLGLYRMILRPTRALSSCQCASHAPPLRI